MLVALLRWSTFTLGILVVAIGLVTLAGREILLPWVRRRFQWQPYGWLLVCLGSMSLLGLLIGPATDFSVVLGTIVFLGSVATAAAGCWLSTRMKLPS
jgi:hypothetical protein